MEGDLNPLWKAIKALDAYSDLVKTRLLKADGSTNKVERELLQYYSDIKSYLVSQTGGKIPKDSVTITMKDLSRLDEIFIK